MTIFLTLFFLKKLGKGVRITQGHKKEFRADRREERKKVCFAKNLSILSRNHDDN